MTPHSKTSPKLAFIHAARKEDVEGMRAILNCCPEHLSPIGVPELLTAFIEALNNGRTKTLEFLRGETRLTDLLPPETLSAQMKAR